MSHLLSAQGLSFHLAATGDTCWRTEPRCCERAAAGQKKLVSQPPWRRGVPVWAQTSVHGLVDCLWPLVKASGKKEKEREGEKPSLGQGPRVIAAFSFTPEVLCDLGENRYSLNRPGTGGICWLVRGMCMLQGTTKGLHDTCFVLEGQSTSYLL